MNSTNVIRPNKSVRKRHKTPQTTVATTGTYQRITLNFRYQIWEFCYCQRLARADFVDIIRILLGSSSNLESNYLS